MVNMIIDGKNVSAQKDTMLLEAIRGAGISVPTLCAHEAVSRSGACRLCVVEIKKATGPGSSPPVSTVWKKG